MLAMDAKEEYLHKIKSLNEEITLLKYKKESLQDDYAHYYKQMMITSSF